MVVSATICLKSRKRYHHLSNGTEKQALALVVIRRMLGRHSVMKWPIYIIRDSGTLVASSLIIIIFLDKLNSF